MSKILINYREKKVVWLDRAREGVGLGLGCIRIRKLDYGEGKKGGGDSSADFNIK